MTGNRKSPSDEPAGPTVPPLPGPLLSEYRGARPRIDPTAWIAPTAVLIGDVHVGPQASIWFGAVLRADGNRIVIGPRTNIQDGCILHVNDRNATIVGADVTVGHAAVMEGCRIGDGALIGMRALVLDGAEIGAGSLVAAGSVVGERTVVPPGHLAAGSPAEVKKPLGPAASARLAAGAAHYVEWSARYADPSQVRVVDIADCIVPPDERSEP